MSDFSTKTMTTRVNKSAYFWCCSWSWKTNISNFATNQTTNKGFLLVYFAGVMDAKLADKITGSMML